jgi:hypothetical protein
MRVQEKMGGACGEREQMKVVEERLRYTFHEIETCAGGSWLGSGTDGPGTMMVRIPSCISVITFSA